MATVTKGRTFTSGETVTPAKLNELVDNATVTSIVNADISESAAIAYSKLNLANSIVAGDIASDAVTTTKILNANVTPAKLSQPYTLETAKASTSGTSVEFTGIPSWAKRITIMFNAVSTNANSVLGVQIGSGSYATSGYSGTMWSSSTGTQRTDMFPVFSTNSAANNACGLVVLANISANIWVQSSVLVFGNTQSTGWSSAGLHTTLSGALDRIRVTTAAGDTFDAGTINISYEG